jgi:hypothetical protein
VLKKTRSEAAVVEAMFATEEKEGIASDRLNAGEVSSMTWQPAHQDFAIISPLARF